MTSTALPETKCKQIAENTLFNLRLNADVTVTVVTNDQHGKGISAWRARKRNLGLSRFGSAWGVCQFQDLLDEHSVNQELEVCRDVLAWNLLPQLEIFSDQMLMEKYLT